GKTDVADIFGDVVVEGLGLFEIAGAAAGEFLGFGTDVGSRIGATSFEGRIPLRNFLPVLESGELDVGNFSRRLFARGVIVIRDGEIRMAPAIDDASVSGFGRERAFGFVDLPRA